jgi:hypothetical protein
VTVFQFFFLGFLPEYLMDKEVFKLGRIWYLKAGMLYTIYYLLMLALYPIETLTIWVIATIRRNSSKSKQILQKDLNNVVVGAELDYSHKFGRLMAHAAIAYYHGVGLPVLYLLFLGYIGMFVMAEKALMLRFYRKLEIQAPYVRQYIIHCLLLMLMFHYFRTIDLLGAGEVFPDKYKAQATVKSGTIKSVYIPEETKYAKKLGMPQGIPYLLFAIIVTIYYVLIWWSHKDNILGKFLGWSSLLTKPNKNLIHVTTLRNRNLCFMPDTYKFNKMPKYKEAVTAVEAALAQSNFGASRVDSPDSQYDMKSEANSGDEVVLDKKSENKEGGVFNIYRNWDPNVSTQKKDGNYQNNKVDSDGLEEDL